MPPRLVEYVVHGVVCGATGYRRFGQLGEGLDQSGIDQVYHGAYTATCSLKSTRRAFPQGGLVTRASEGGPGIRRAHTLVHDAAGGYRLTDLEKTALEGVQSPFFRLFVPIRHGRMRLPTSLPEFRDVRHTATLSDSPVTAASSLGGHWSDHNLAAITHVAACNFRCSYCYVDYRHLSGKDSRAATAGELVDDFVRICRRLASQGRRLSILRLSGGEPLLAPGLIADVHRELEDRDLLGESMLKVESNLSALPFSYQRLDVPQRQAFDRAATSLALHATLHARPGEPEWHAVMRGLEFSVDLGMDVYPAIGGADWSAEDMRTLFDRLSSVSQGLVTRLAVRPFNLGYAERYGRRVRLQEATDRPSAVGPSVYWEELLRERIGEDYLSRPRHEIGLS